MCLFLLHVTICHEHWLLVVHENILVVLVVHENIPSKSGKLLHTVSTSQVFFRSLQIASGYSEELNEYPRFCEYSFDIVDELAQGMAINMPHMDYRPNL